jgi:dCTP deaminase
MILPDYRLTKWAVDGGLRPCIVENINPASVDLTLGFEYIDLLTGERHALGPMEMFTLQPGQAILATTAEYVKMPADCAGTIFLKSSMARRGLDHALAGWIDPSFEGQITLELHTHRIIRLTAGQRICQLVLTRMESIPERGYDVTGRYQGQMGPTEAR